MKNFQKSVSICIGLDNIAELLIQKGADVNVVGQYGVTALLFATQNGKYKKCNIYLVPCQIRTNRAHFSDGRRDACHIWMDASKKMDI